MLYQKILLLAGFCLFTFTLSAQEKMNNYEKNWQKIDSQINKSGLLKTALKEIDDIYQKAKKENNHPQLIKALIYKININESVTEETINEKVTLINSEIESAPQPAKSILYSIAASYYWNYLQQNRWKFYNRTNTTESNKTDIQTWTITDLHNKISTLFSLSLEQSDTLKKTALAPYDPIIQKGNVRFLRPTLFDLLAHRALHYYESGEKELSQPAYAFKLQDAEAFAGARAFSQHVFPTKDSSSLQYKALLLYQQLTSFHLNDLVPDALIDLNISRIVFAKNYSTHPDKEKLYSTALQQLITRFPHNGTATQATYLLAQWYTTRAQQYDPLRDTSYRYDYVKALQLCESTFNISGRPEGKANCMNLAHNIRQKTIGLQTEKVNSIGQPFRALISYKNFTSAHFRIIQIDKKLKEKIGHNQWEDKFWQQLANLSSIRSFKYNFPDTEDYQNHDVEIKIDALPSGEYALLASTNSDFGTTSNALAVQYFYVSDIAYVNSNDKYYVVNRNNGNALANAAVQIWQNQYDYQQRKSVLRKLESYTTNKNGFFALTKNKESYRNYQLDITYGKDRLFLDNNYYYYTYSEPVIKEKDHTYFFTDRSIYRPGQTIYFKGIVVTNSVKDNPPSIVTQKKSTVKLYDENNEVVDSITVTTNDYGSYSGKFTLPTHLLNGRFTLKDESNNSIVSFSVEEYKRPKFFVELPKPSGTYKLNENITVGGNAKAYAGNNITDATVNYRVVRRTIMPLWQRDWYTRIWPPYQNNIVEIANGITTTDENGKFTISFQAIPDELVDKKINPIFHYEIATDITDINGETRSASTIINVGYASLKIDVQSPDKTTIGEFKALQITTTNMNDVFEKTVVNIAIHKLKQPSRDFRDRYWKQPDQYIMSREEYYKHFPYDQYDNENDITHWAKEKKVLDKQITTIADSATNITQVKFQPGFYVIEVTAKDKDGEEVKTVKYVELTDPKTAPLIKYADNKELPASKFYVKNNRLTVESVDIKTPDTEKDLMITYSTFREKILPGANEKWKIIISGKRGEKVAAELLTAMYDKSLDQFRLHQWSKPNLWRTTIDYSQWRDPENFTAVTAQNRVFDDYSVSGEVKEYDRLNIPEYGSGRNAMPISPLAKRGIAGNEQVMQESAVQLDEVAVSAAPKAGYANDNAVADTATTTPTSTVQPRTNLNETAFFFPDLRTDSAGNIEFSFTAPEALTEWKWLLLAHTKDLKMGMGEKTMVTQKELMVQPNLPRFLREGDKINLSAKIVNLSNADIQGNARLQLLDQETGKLVNDVFSYADQPIPFNVKTGQSIPVQFTISVPNSYTNPVVCRIVAEGANLSDGEENLLPVLTNRMLVTETLPLTVKGNATKNFSFDKLINSGSSNTLQQHRLTVEFTGSPAWYAVQALPYLSEGAKENVEQIFNRYYANAIAFHIINSSPRFKAVIEKWKTADTSALLSALQKNEELKGLLLQETPWVLEAKTESQQKRNLALLFDLNNMSASLTSALNQLQQMQAPSGGFIWAPGGRENRYMTQYILSGIGHLKQLGALPKNEKLNLLIKAGVSFLDKEIKKDYELLKASNKKLPTGSIANIPVQYLYMRSFFTDISVPGDVFTTYNYYRNQSKEAWIKHNTYLRAMIALSLFRTGDVATAQKIMAALKETAINNSDLGSYWKDMNSGYYWHEAPIEAQSVVVEAFSEITKDNNMVNNIRTWLLHNKQTNNWKTTKSTADACYALLLQGSNWMEKNPEVTIDLGKHTISSVKQSTEAGSGYFSTQFNRENIQPEMGNIKVTVTDNDKTATAWGAIYWQYFEDLDKISSAATPLQISKQLFTEKNTDRGKVIDPSNNNLKIGDKVIVRIEIRVDRDLEYVHMKDMRSSCMEPVNVLSNYKWQDGLGYYETTKDAATHFYFDNIRKGTYVFEYPMFVSQEGDFSNGIATIQCLYAPEFTSHSEGIKLSVTSK